MSVINVDVEKMHGARGKPKEVRTIKIDKKAWRVLTETPPQVWQIDRYLLNDTLGIPDGEKNETLVASFDKENRQLVIKKVRLKYQVEVDFVD